MNSSPDPADPADPPDPPDQMSSTAARNLPTTRAGGQDDGSYTNSLKKMESTEILAFVGGRLRSPP